MSSKTVPVQVAQVAAHSKTVPVQVAAQVVRGPLGWEVDFDPPGTFPRASVILQVFRNDSIAETIVGRQPRQISIWRTEQPKQSPMKEDTDIRSWPEADPKGPA